MPTMTDAIDVLDIEEVLLHPENPRQGNVGKIKASLERFGQVRPIIVQRGSNYIVAGNHTWKAAMELGWSKIAVIYVSMDEDEALAYVLADNKTADAGGYNDEALITALEKLNEQSSLIGTGYSLDDLEDLQAAIGKFHETTPEDFTGDYAEPPEATAARWEGRDEGQRREVVFLLDHERFEQFRNNVNVLKSRYDTDSMSDAIYEAVAREAMGG